MTDIPQQPKCIGIKGRLFGHKFVWSDVAYIYGLSDTCQRCGYKP
jgi:hypothetical protein